MSNSAGIRPETLATTASAPGLSRAVEQGAHPDSSRSGGQAAIIIRGARVHNLKNIDCEIPHNHLTVVTGVSGSGKSSLAFDTLYAEGQRRYVESLSAYARQFLERMEKPDADEISGIAPAVAIRQKNSTRNPRSTVATATEIYDYLRLLFARVGVTVCPNCGEAVRKDTVEEAANRVLSLEPGRRFQVMFQLPATSPSEPAKAESAEVVEVIAGLSLRPPPANAGTSGVRRKPGRAKKAAAPRSGATLGGENAPQHYRLPGDPVKDTLTRLRQRGFNRLFQNGRIFEFSVPESLLDIDFSKPVFILVDRLSVSPENKQRLNESLETCFREGGEAIIEFPASAPLPVPERMAFNERFECKRCGKTFPQPEPRLFSFNNPFGACPRCQGFGNTIDIDLNRVIPDQSLSLSEGAINPWTKPRYREWFNWLKREAKSRSIPLSVPYQRLDEEEKQWVIEGAGEFPGVRGFFAALERKKYKLHVRVFLSRYRGYALCPDCQGRRLRPEALNVRLGEKNIFEVCRLTIGAAREFFNHLRFSPTQVTIAEKVLEEIQSRLGFLNEAGLEYLTLDRLASTLSGGESQRIQLATSLGSNLVGALYVLDEPSIGLHPRDIGRLTQILKRLRDLGNTIVVVEHDPAMMRQADHILDLGPGAGELGGRMIYEGGFDGLLANHDSLTGRYLSGNLEIPIPRARRKPRNGWLTVRGARQHNLKSIDVSVPLGTLTCVSGVSGSGKSTLVHDVLYNALLAQRGVAAAQAEYGAIEGGQLISDVVLVDQSPLGRTPRSNPITYIKAFGEIRELFASTAEARRLGYAPGYFSFNIPGGRCETCQGDGVVTVEMQFLADVELVCEECRGRRYKPSVLQIHYKGKNVAQVLHMTVHEAITFFAGVSRVIRKLRVLEEIGLGYLRLGQSATSLSGGEAQRLRLAAHMSEVTNAGTLFILDEPTTGLHADDISKLLAAFRKLVDSEDTVLVIEHNLDVLKSADWIVDLGPEGGELGGHVVASGPPEAIAAEPLSHTGRFLRPLLKATSH